MRLTSLLLLCLLFFSACTPFTATAAPTSTARTPAPTTSFLVINPDGVLYADSFMLAPFAQGGSSVLLNLQPLIAEAGFQCGWDDWTRYNSLEGQQASVQGGARRFSGRMPGGESLYEQKIFPQGRDVHFELTLDAGNEADDIGWAEFAFYLPLAIFQNQRYLTDRGEGVYPATYGAGTLADNLRELQFLPDDPTRNLTLRAPGGGISLADGRQWGSQFYMVAVRLPLDGSTLHFTLTPPPADPGPNPPAVRYSRAGYLPVSPKQAVLEIDWRDSFPSLAVRLERRIGSGAQTVLAGEFVPALQDFWKQFAVFDFSAVEERGEYRLVWAGGATDWFPIAPNVFENRWQKTLDFFFPFQMSHAAVDLGGGLAHAASTLDDAIAVPPNTVGADGFISYEADGAAGYVPLDVGGWFDAGDYDLNVATQAFVVHQLALAWEEFAPPRDLHGLDVANRRLNVQQPNGVPDLLEQIEWGTRWLLAMQTAEGRVFVGVVESPDQYSETALPEAMTDGIPNTGDERWLFHDYHSDVNLKFIAATAAASRALRASNPQLAELAWQAALRAWDYFQNHPEVYRETIYFSDNEEGREQMIAAAAVELYLTQPDPAYLQTLEQFTAYFAHLPDDWPAPTGSIHSGFWYAPPFLARLYPHLTNGALRTSIRAALEDAADSLYARAGTQPFPLMGDWPYTEWGMSGAYLNALGDAYWLQKALPQRVQMADFLPAAYWLYGLHPVNDFTLVFGSGLPEPRYHYHSILHVRSGSAPASVPGAVVPGIATLTDARVLYYLDQPETYRNNEACIYDAASFLFAMLALQPGDASEPSPLYLPLVSNPPVAQTVTFTPSTADIPTPERGIYNWPDNFTPASLADYAAQGYTLAYQRETLRDFIASDLPPHYLDSLAARFQAVRQAGLKVILRFNYNEGESYPNPAPDASLAQVLRHIQQLAPVLEANQDVIAWFEAGFIGAWGEWHSSASGLDTPENKAAIRDAIFQHFPRDRFVLFRYPGDFIGWHPQPLTEVQAFTQTVQARTGFHNDCFLASDDDWGTYSDSNGELRAEEWKAYIAQMGRFTPVSGETCNPNPPRSDCETALQETAYLHWSAMNEGWHPGVIQRWKDQGCYAEIRRRLGYRLTLLEATFSPEVRPGSEMRVQVKLQNTGFASPLLERPVYLVLAGQDSLLHYEANVDPRRWTPGEHVFAAALSLPADLPPGGYTLALWLPDPAETLRADPRYAMRFANEGAWDAAHGWNVLGRVQR